MTAVGLAVIWMVSPAGASIEMAFDEIDPSSGMTMPLAYNGGSVTARVGQLLWTTGVETGVPVLTAGNPDTLLTFCIELGQYVSRQTRTYTKTAVEDAPDPLISGNPATGYKIGDDRAEALDVAADNLWSVAAGADVVSAVAFQLLVWEIVHESPTGGDNLLPSTLDVSNAAATRGAFYVNSTPLSGSDLDMAIDLANDWLTQLLDGDLEGNDDLSLLALTHRYKQDQIVQYVSPGQQGGPEIPEPTALLVWSGFAGLAGLVASGRHSR